MNRAVARLGLRAEWSPHPVFLFFFVSLLELSCLCFCFFPSFLMLKLRTSVLNRLHRVHGLQVIATNSVWRSRLEIG
jgi:hypothetical protein